MNIEFGTKNMREACSSDKSMCRTYGDRMARKLRQRLAELEAVETLADLSRMPATGFHELEADRKGQLAVDLVDPHRLIFVPDSDPPPTKADWGTGLGEVKGIVVVEVVD